MSLNIEFQTLDAGSVFHVKASDFVPGWDAFIRPAPAAWEGQDGHFYDFQSLDVYLDALSIAESMAEDDRPVVPVAVRMAAARVALIRVGKKQDVEALIDSLPAQQRDEARERWEYEVNVRRDDALVAFIQASLGWTNEFVDELFIVAAGL